LSIAEASEGLRPWERWFWNGLFKGNILVSFVDDVEKIIFLIFQKCWFFGMTRVFSV
jgi:hypothetical protein